MNKLKSWQYSQNSIEILEPIILKNDTYCSRAEIDWLLSNNSRLLDMAYWGWRYHVCQELPMFAEAS